MEQEDCVVVCSTYCLIEAEAEAEAKNKNKNKNKTEAEAYEMMCRKTIRGSFRREALYAGVRHRSLPHRRVP